MYPIQFLLRFPNLSQQALEIDLTSVSNEDEIIMCAFNTSVTDQLEACSYTRISGQWEVCSYLRLSAQWEDCTTLEKDGTVSRNDNEICLLLINKEFNLYIPQNHFKYKLPTMEMIYIPNSNFLNLMIGLLFVVLILKMYFLRVHLIVRIAGWFILLS